MNSKAAIFKVIEELLREAKKTKAGRDALAAAKVKAGYGAPTKEKIVP